METISDPCDSSGLIVRKSNGVDVPLRLEESEAAIQGGSVLQILTANEFQTQAHRVVPPSDSAVGTMSCVHSVYPPLDLEIQPLGSFQSNGTLPCPEELNTRCSEDADIIPKETLVSNHWYPKVKWIEFHQNQIL